MPPTHAPLAYPEPAPPFGRTQTLETVGTGPADVLVELVVVTEHTPAVVVVLTTTGGFFLIQSLLLQPLPMQVLLQ